MTDIEKRIAEKYRRKSLESLLQQKAEREAVRASKRVIQPHIVRPKQPSVSFSHEQGGWSIDKEFDYALDNELSKP